MPATKEQISQTLFQGDEEATLTPVGPIPPTEAWFWDNPSHVAAAQRGLADAAAGRVTPPQSFAQYADLDITEEWTSKLS